MGREWKPGDSIPGTRWTIVGEPEWDERRRRRVPVQCMCGTTRRVRAEKLHDGRSRSCGCLARELNAARMTKHGWSRTPEYRTWQDMIQRCTNPQAERYADYGARGITVCQRWLSSFENFLADMGGRPAGLSLDRIEVNGHYDPSNCRWATRSEQNANRRPRDACRNGHPYSPANTRWRAVRGGRVRQCITCCHEGRARREGRAA